MEAGLPLGPLPPPCLPWPRSLGPPLGLEEEAVAAPGGGGYPGAAGQDGGQGLGEKLQDEEGSDLPKVP